MEEPIPWSIPRPLDSSGLSKTELRGSKYGESKTMSGCRLKKLRRISH